MDNEVVVGIDEAGRGPVMGYLVYGALVSTEAVIANAKFYDSKVMSKTAREQQFEIIKSSMSFAYNAIHPQYITENMTCHGKNLNVISFEAMFDILDAIHKTYTVKRIFVDTVGDPEKHRAMLEKRYRTPCVVETKADSKYKVVSGASIVAKVVRDDLIEKLAPTCGSGYPGDPITRQWMKRNLNPVFGYSDIVRFPWATVDEFLPKRRSQKMKGTFSGFCLSPK